MVPREPQSSNQRAKTGGSGGGWVLDAHVANPHDQREQEGKG